MKNKLFITAIFAILLMTIVVPSALAADATISSGGSYEIDTSYGNSSIVTISTTDAVTLTQNDPLTALTDFQIVCSPGTNLTINGINIDNSANSDTCAISFSGTGNTLSAEGTNTVISGENEPGIRVEGTDALTINGYNTSILNVKAGKYAAGIGSGYLSDTAGIIYISGGSITAIGGERGAGIGGGSEGGGITSITINNCNVTAKAGELAAGIGSGYFSDTAAGTIYISDSTVETIGGRRGAGIGGGYGSDGGSITINDSNVTAQGGNQSAGIGGGFYGDGGTINISGGTVTATSIQNNGAGIGGGFHGDSGTIYIDGSIVIATGGYGGAGIGSGIYGDAETIDISGGSVTATGGEGAAGIGGGEAGTTPGVGGGDAKTIIISGSLVTATGGEDAAGIGGGYKGDVGTISISGGLVTATGGGNAAGIGGGSEDGGITGITIKNCNVTAKAGTYAAGIGSGYLSDTAGTIYISGSTVETTGGERGAGIGGGSEGGGITSITINNCNVTAKAGELGAGIGSGYFSDTAAGTIYISDSTVETTGGRRGAGIGGGYGSDGGNITINDSNVTAQGGNQSAGIGGGFYGDGGTINISGGTVTATSIQNNGAGIGGGFHGDSGTIYIDGSIVIATGGYGGAGIGSGIYGDAETIDISGGSITATGGEGAAGIGGGEAGTTPGVGGGDAGTISISGGSVIATGGGNAAGIGGGYSGKGGDIDISGGVIYADSGGIDNNDIGAGADGLYSTISISGDAVVFLRYNTLSAAPTTTTHKLFSDETISSEMAYGYTVPASWSGTAYAYLKVYKVTYSSGAYGEFALGSIASENVRDGEKAQNPPTVEPYGTCEFDGWSDGINKYNDVSLFTINTDITLEAQYNLIHISHISLNTANATLILGDADTTNDSIQLSETITPSNASYKDLEWSSSDETVAAVSSTGLVTSVSAGTATITAKTMDGGYTDTCVVTVEQSVTGVVLNYSEMTMEVGDTAQINCTVEPDDATDKSTSWSSDNTPVATVAKDTDEQAEITANTVGVAYITVTTNDGGYTDICKVTVIDMTEYAVSKYGGLTGNLLQNDGNGLANWNVTLYSTPVSVTTNASGAFSYNNVQYSRHTLVFTDDTGAEFDRYTLNFSSGSSTGYSMSGDTIALNYTSRTTSIDMEFRMDSAGTGIELADVSFTQKAVNPQTGDNGINCLGKTVLLICILSLLIYTAVVLTKKKVIE